MRKMLYALAAVAAMAPLAAFGTASAASAAPAHPAPPDVHVIPLNLPANKCFKITDADTSAGHNYGSLWYNGSKVVSSHSHYTDWCPGMLSDGYQVLIDYTTLDYMAYHASGDYLTEYAGSGASPECAVTPSGAHDYCEWVEFLSSDKWTIESIYNGEYITGVKSGSPVELAESGHGDQDWTADCSIDC
jgi:hypothetical protein